MESSSLLGDVLSPESTVTSLLSSSGHLRSSLLPAEHNATFRYRDKTYDSATAALDAYIADFEMNHHNTGSQTGRLALPHSPPSTPRRPTMCTLKNRDSLRDCLTEKELDFLKLPVSSLCHRDNRDRLSMTTDELLSVPYDGSMPTTHTSAFIQGLLSQSGASQCCCSSSRQEYRACVRKSREYTAPQPNHLHPCLIWTPKGCRCRKQTDAATFETLDGIAFCTHRGSELATPPSSLHLSHRFTSNKNNMNSSGMSSGPDLRYPVWIQQCDISEPSPPPESEPCDYRAARTRAPSWLAELEDDDPHQTLSQVDTHQLLRGLTLQFAEQISLLTAERKSSDVVETMFRDNRIESLIQKADRVLNSLFQSSGHANSSADSVSPMKTEDLLLSSPSHHPLFSLESAAARGATDALTDQGAQALGCGHQGNVIWKQPGPVEALKQMLFKLQAVEAELERQEQKASVAPTVSDGPQTEDTVIIQEVSQARQVKERPDGEMDVFSGGLSLQRALHHLSRLKLLVEEPRAKHKQDELKDEDEGHYSSSSPDDLVCAQLKPT